MESILFIIINNYGCTSCRDNSLICRVAGILAGDMIQGSAPKPVDLDIAKKGSEPQKKRSAGGRRTGGCVTRMHVIIHVTCTCIY